MQEIGLPVLFCSLFSFLPVCAFFSSRVTRSKRFHGTIVNFFPSRRSLLLYHPSYDTRDLVCKQDFPLLLRFVTIEIVLQSLEIHTDDGDSRLGGLTYDGMECFLSP